MLHHTIAIGRRPAMRIATVFRPGQLIVSRERFEPTEAEGRLLLVHNSTSKPPRLDVKLINTLFNNLIRRLIKCRENDELKIAETGKNFK